MCNSEICEVTGCRDFEEAVRDLRNGEGGSQLCGTQICTLNLISVEQVEYNDDGLTALIFTSEGDMRQAINNLQSTFSGFGFVSGDNVFKVCDQPHPIVMQAIIRACMKSNIEGAMEKLSQLWGQGYSAVDIVVTLFRVVKTFDE